MNLPLPIETYFYADRRRDSEALLQAFTPDALVRDEGQSHGGCQAIEAWWRAAKTKYQHTAEPIDCTEENGEHRVRARVTGDFPGSPAVLTFAFRLRGNRIAHLEIGA